MNRLLLLITGVITTLACSHRMTVATGNAATPAAAATKPKRDSSERVPFWSDTIRQWSTLSRGWNRIPGRFGTGCAHDSLYAFKVRPGLPDKVLIFLNGGGMCWRSAQCDPRRPSVVTSADDPLNDVSIRAGILDNQNEKNPVRDWTVVFVPYCTGDAYLGSSEVEYVQPGGRGDAKTFKFRHGGAANLEAMTDWLYVNVKRPTTLFVVGTDAGAVASPVVAARMARHYPRTNVVQLGEGAGSYRSDSLPVMLGIWGGMEYLQQDPTYRGIDSASLNFQRLYTAAARSSPRIRFAQINSIDDPTQLSFLASLGVKATSLAKPLAANFAELREQAPSFRSYTAPGRAHSILRTGAFYTLKVDNTALVDWLATLVNSDTAVDVGQKLVAPVPTPARTPAPKPAKKKPSAD